MTTTDDLDFKKLLQEIQEGSEEAARAFLDKYGKYILRVIRRRLAKRLRSKFDSSDFLQDVCASFFRDPPPPEAFNEREALLAFLAQMARNKVAQANRQRLERRRYADKPENSLDGSARYLARGLQGGDPTPSAVAVAREQWLDIVERKRPDHEKILFLLHEGYTHEEIAGLLGLSAKSVQRLVNKLRERFLS
jgi:RNA polymerase sigma-70 factor (ECF subfamily)